MFGKPFAQVIAGVYKDGHVVVHGIPAWRALRRGYYRRAVADAVGRLPEREKERTLAIMLGASGERVGSWCRRDGSGVAHFWVTVKREGFDVRVAVCGRYTLGRYGSHVGGLHHVHDIGTRHTVCHACAYLVEQEGA